MTVFLYDKSFEGLLTCVFEAYSQKCFPEMLLDEGDTLPLFYDKAVNVVTGSVKSERVWKGLEKKLSREALEHVWLCSLADGYPHADELIFRYICKAIDHSSSIEVNFGDPDVLEMSRVFKQVSYEVQRMKMFVRFQKAADGTYFAPFEPQHDVLSLAVDHFKDRFGDQKWVIYDIKRGYGYFFDLVSLREVTFSSEEEFLKTGLLADGILDEEEMLMQNMWKAYFKSICIKERLNPRKHRQDMPVRYWKHLTEKKNPTPFSKG